MHAKLVLKIIFMPIMVLKSGLKPDGSRFSIHQTLGAFSLDIANKESLRQLAVNIYI